MMTPFPYNVTISLLAYINKWLATLSFLNTTKSILLFWWLVLQVSFALFHFLNQFPYIVVQTEEVTQIHTHIHPKINDKQQQTFNEHSSMKNIESAVQQSSHQLKTFQRIKSFFNVFVMAFVLALTHTCSYTVIYLFHSILCTFSQLHWNRGSVACRCCLLL